MSFKVTEFNSVFFVEAEVADRIGLDNINDVFSFCYETNAERVLLFSENLPAGFFDLSTRIAGEFLQKFSTYRCKAAIVISPQTVKSSRFGELASELSRSGTVRFFEDRAKALEWLIE